MDELENHSLKDCFGQEVKIGDIIMYPVSASRSGKIQFYKVIEITKTGQKKSQRSAPDERGWTTWIQVPVYKMTAMYFEPKGWQSPEYHGKPQKPSVFNYPERCIKIESIKSLDG